MDASVDVARGRCRAGRHRGRDHRHGAGASTSCCVDKAPSRATRRAATGSPPARCASLEALGARSCAELRRLGMAVRETVLVVADRPARVPAPAADDGAARRGRRPRVDLDAALVASPGAGRRRPRAVRGREVAAHGDEVELPAAAGDGSVRARHVIAADGHWSPCGGARAGRAAATSAMARGAPVLRRRQRRAALGAVRSATCSPATRGCSRCPDGGANVGYGVLRVRRP